MEFINLTPYEVRVLADNDIPTVFPPAAVSARCTTKRQILGKIGDITITKTVFGETKNLPEPQEGVAYIVNRIVAEANPERKDLYIPDDTIRDQQGRIIGCRALTQV